MKNTFIKIEEITVVSDDDNNISHLEIEFEVSRSANIVASGTLEKYRPFDFENILGRIIEWYDERYG